MYCEIWVSSLRGSSDGLGVRTLAKNEYKEPRGRNFAFVQLVENLPDDWQEIAAGKLLPLAWVLHDKDVYTEKDEMKDPTHKAGEPKKPHVHFFVYFNGKRTASGVVSMFSEFNISYAEKIECKNAYLAYMLHLRQEGKHQYDYSDMHIMNGLKVNFADLSDVDFGDVLSFAEEYNITRFSELVQAARRKDPPIFRYVTGHFSLVCAYFADAREG